MHKKKALRIGIMAGEASGDLIGASLITAILRQEPDTIIEGIGGLRMAAAGCHCLYDNSPLAVMGFIAPLRRLRTILRIRQGIIQHFISDPPDVVIGIDSPDFMLGVEKQLKSYGITTVHYVSPTVWAWRAGRINTIKAAVDHILVLLPFEEKIYQDAGVPVTFVGHALADDIPLAIKKSEIQETRLALGLAIDRPIVALLAGSRTSEWKTLIPLFVETACQILQMMPHVQFIAPTVQTAAMTYWSEAQKRMGVTLPIVVTPGGARDALLACDVALVKSGTATLEAMLLKKPMTIVYKTSAINYWIAKMVVRVPYIGLPNLLANKSIVPELIQEDVTPMHMAKSVLQQLLEGGGAMAPEFNRIHLLLARGASVEAAAVVIALGRKKHAKK